MSLSQVDQSTVKVSSIRSFLADLRSQGLNVSVQNADTTGGFIADLLSVTDRERDYVHEDYAQESLQTVSEQEQAADEQGTSVTSESSDSRETTQEASAGAPHTHKAKHGATQASANVVATTQDASVVDDAGIDPEILAAAEKLLGLTKVSGEEVATSSAVAATTADDQTQTTGDATGAIPAALMFLRQLLSPHKVVDESESKAAGQEAETSEKETGAGNADITAANTNDQLAAAETVDASAQDLFAEIFSAAQGEASSQVEAAVAGVSALPVETPTLKMTQEEMTTSGAASAPDSTDATTPDAIKIALEKVASALTSETTLSLSTGAQKVKPVAEAATVAVQATAGEADRAMNFVAADQTSKDQGRSGATENNVADDILTDMAARVELSAKVSVSTSTSMKTKSLSTPATQTASVPFHKASSDVLNADVHVNVKETSATLTAKTDEGAANLVGGANLESFSASAETTTKTSTPVTSEALKQAAAQVETEVAPPILSAQAPLPLLSETKESNASFKISADWNGTDSAQASNALFASDDATAGTTSFGAAASGRTGASSFANTLASVRSASNAGRAQSAVEQVSLHISHMVKSGDDQLTLKLSPEDLGTVEVKLNISSDKKVTATVKADNQSTLDLLKQDADKLQQALQDAGLQADANGLQFSLRDNGQSNESPQSGAGKQAAANANALDDAATVSADATVEAEEQYIISPTRVNLKV